MDKPKPKPKPVIKYVDTRVYRPTDTMRYDAEERPVHTSNLQAVLDTLDNYTKRVFSAAGLPSGHIDFDQVRGRGEPIRGRAVVDEVQRLGIAPTKTETNQAQVPDAEVKTMRLHHCFDIAHNGTVWSTRDDSLMCPRNHGDSRLQSKMDYLFGGLRESPVDSKRLRAIGEGIKETMEQTFRDPVSGMFNAEHTQQLRMYNRNPALGMKEAMDRVCLRQAERAQQVRELYGDGEPGFMYPVPKESPKPKPVDYVARIWRLFHGCVLSYNGNIRTLCSGENRALYLVYVDHHYPTDVHRFHVEWATIGAHSFEIRTPIPEALWEPAAQVLAQQTGCTGAALRGFEAKYNIKIAVDREVPDLTAGRFDNRKYLTQGGRPLLTVQDGEYRGTNSDYLD